MSSLVNLYILDACAEFDCFTSIVCRSTVYDFDVLEIMCLDPYGAGSGSFTVVVVACVADIEADVAFFDEVDRFLIVFCAGGVDGVGDVIADDAFEAFGRESIAALVQEGRGHYRGRTGVVRLRVEAYRLHLRASCSVVCFEIGVVADAGKWDGCDELAAEDVVEGLPF